MLTDIDELVDAPHKWFNLEESGSGRIGANCRWKTTVETRYLCSLE